MIEACVVLHKYLIEENDDVLVIGGMTLICLMSMKHLVRTMAEQSSSTATAE